ncbi:hypothetical protein BCR37DRAFT_348560, partial [Protomyces lactucae-debilis]
IGKLVHYSFDAVVVSAMLAGIKRSTGLSPKTSSIENKDIRGAVDRYLGVGEWVMDVSIGYMSSSAYFERKR